MDVLGASKLLERGDLNDIKTFGLYVVSYNVSNKPSAFGTVPCYMSVEDYLIGNQHVVRQVASRTGNPSYTRFFSDNTWGDWKAVYDENILTNSALLSPLASALGVLGKTSNWRYYSNSGDFNDAKVGIESFVNGNHSISNAPVKNPSGDSWGVILTAGYFISINSTNNRLVQIVFDYPQKAVFVRFFNNGSWNDWVYFEMSDL